MDQANIKASIQYIQLKINSVKKSLRAKIREALTGYRLLWVCRGSPTQRTGCSPPPGTNPTCATTPRDTWQNL